MEYESVKINKEVVQKVRELKVKMKIPIGSFFEISALEKINEINSRPKASKKIEP